MRFSDTLCVAVGAALVGSACGASFRAHVPSIIRHDRWRGGATAVEESETDTEVEDPVSDVEEAEAWEPQLFKVKEGTFSEHCVIELSSAQMKALDIESDTVMKLKGKRRTWTVCTVRAAKKKTAATSARLSKATLRNLRLNDGDIVRLEEKYTDTPPSAAKVTLAPFSDTLEGADDAEERAELVKEHLGKLDGCPLRVGDHFFTTTDEGDVEWKVLALEKAGDEEEEDEDTDVKVALLAEDTEIVMGEDLLDRSDDDDTYNEVTYADVGGCEKAMADIRELVETPLLHAELFEAVGLPPPHGVLIHGASGTGKTLLTKAIANEVGVFTKIINGPEVMARKSGESESNLRDAFKEARDNAPAMILLDEVDSIAPKRDKAGGEVEKRMVSQLLTLMDGLKKNDNVVVIAATNRANAIDPALRRFGRFDREIDMGIPTEEGRLSILQIKTKNMKLADDVDLEQIAQDSHGFVGSDLAQLTLDAALRAVRDQMGNIDIDCDSLDQDMLDGIRVCQHHFLAAADACNPSSLRDSAVEVPDVKWEDIGGLEDTKRELKELVEFPVQFGAKFEHFGMRPSRGVLFYGPPGCGKTLLAKAIANECKANFLSIKGPELLTMWFGESESNVRNLFDKARAAAPCILFFDEMDSIAKSRAGSGGGSDAGDRVMNQILAEIDVVSQRNVFVIGATNRPDILDTAITRPGRLDQLIYIPLPDHPSRVSIFQATLRKSPIAEDVTFELLADVTEGFSAADVAEICQRAAKNAIREAIAADEEEKLLVAEEGDEYLELEEGEEEDEWVDPVPCITRAHFEEAMSYARKSVPDSEIQRYNEFAKKMKVDNANTNDFKF